MAEYQAPMMLNVLASSPAGRLPQGFCGEHKICASQKSTVGASLLAMAM
jgi:hypothetical protein